MVIQKTINNLKDKPQDERKAVAGGIALSVMVILIVGWAFLFFKNIQQEGQLQDLNSSIPEEFNFSSVRDAQEELLEGLSGIDELRTVREQLGGSNGGATVQENFEASETDQFGQPGASE
jgi:hypothetical protein